MILLAKATRAEAIERTSKRTLRRQQGGSKGQAIISYVKKEHRFNALEHMSWDPLGFFFFVAFCLKNFFNVHQCMKSFSCVKINKGTVEVCDGSWLNLLIS